MLTTCLNKDFNILKISGDDSRDYLNKIITNDIEQVNSNNSIYSCLLSPQGKFIADFFISEFNEDFILLIHSRFKDDLIKTLNLYKLRAKFDIEDISAAYEYHFIETKNSSDIFNLNDDLSGKTISYDHSFAFIDPRLKTLGVHVISSNGAVGVTKLDNLQKGYTENFLKHGILNTHLIQDLSKFYPLENNLHLLNGIDFKKGCYVGQEITARMKLRNKIPRTILPFIIDFKDDIQHLQSAIIENSNTVGEIIYQQGLYLFGNISLRKLSSEKISDMTFSLPNNELKINKQSWMGH